MTWAAFYAVVAFVVVGLFIPAAELPDYYSYEQIYQLEGQNYAVASKEALFVWMVGVLVGADLSYEAFRIVALVFVCSALTYAIWRIGASSRSSGGGLVAATAGAALAFSTWIVLLEFAVVRLRAGFAIGLAVIGFSLLTTGRRSSLRVVMGLSALAACMGVHLSTALVLGFFLFGPLGLALAKRVRWLPSRGAELVILGAGTLAVGAAVVGLTVAGADQRGEWLVSPLNPIRFLGICLIPLCIFVWSASRSTFAPQGNTPVALWLAGASECYAAIAVALGWFVAAGLTHEAGEALVRVFSLSSIPAILYICGGGVRFRMFWLYLVTCNAAFFVNTLAAGWS